MCRPGVPNIRWLPHLSSAVHVLMLSALAPSAQDGSVSVWRRQAGALSYAMLGLHRLVPPPSRASNNASLTLLACAAGAWVKGGAVCPGSTVVGPAVLKVGAEAAAAAASAAAAKDNAAPGAATMEVGMLGMGCDVSRGHVRTFALCLMSDGQDDLAPCRH